MRASLAVGLWCGLLVGLGGVCGPKTRVALGGEPPLGPVRIDTTSGRSLSGELDPETDSQTLWLRWSRPGASIRQPIPWERVVHVYWGGEVLSGRDFARALDLPEGGANRPAPEAHARLVLRGKPESPGAEHASPEASGAAARRAALATRVQSLAIGVETANWNGGVEVDGLVVEVCPLDAAGRVIPVRGTLEVDLIGHQATTARPGRTFPQLGRWVQPVAAADFGPCGARYRLAFQSAHPEAQIALAPFGVVHARLSVPGQGVFHASAAAVRIRPYSAVRDEHQRATGQRFFPQERTGPGLR